MVGVRPPWTAGVSKMQEHFSTPPYDLIASGQGSTYTPLCFMTETERMS